MVFTDSVKSLEFFIQNSNSDASLVFIHDNVLPEFEQVAPPSAQIIHVLTIVN